MLDLLRIMTAGSVDDGKSTLIGRLLYDADALYEDHLAALCKGGHASNGQPDFALLTDGLRAEREQGITIDVAYRYFSTVQRHFIIADAPGHEQYTRNMAVAASNADLAILLIDVHQGIVTQSKRHAFICALLGVPRLLVAVNKMDLVGFDEGRFRMIENEYRSFAARLGLKDLYFVPVCAVDGDNLVHTSQRMPWYNGSSLLSYLEEVYVAGDRNLVDFRLPVQRVIRPDPGFRGYSGTIASGVVRSGDEVVTLPSGFRSRVKQIFLGERELAQAVAGQAVTMTLADDLDIARGDLLVHPGNVPRELKVLELMVVWTGEEPLQAGLTLQVKHGTQWVKAKCESIRYRVDPNSLRQEMVEQLHLNDIARIRLALYRPIFADAYSRNHQLGSVLLVSLKSNDTLGAATMVERTDYDTALKTERACPATGDIVWQKGLVSHAERSSLLRQKPLTIWFTGLSGAGKSTLAFALEQKLLQAGRLCYVLDGDNLRHGLNRDLGFSAKDRQENIRRVAEVAHLMNDAGLLVITAFISPFRQDREMARDIIGKDRFLEVFLDPGLEVCEARDIKGLYQMARNGSLPNFTGVSSPYEAPDRPDIRLDTGRMPLENCLELLLKQVMGLQGTWL